MVMHDDVIARYGRAEKLFGKHPKYSVPTYLPYLSNQVSTEHLYNIPKKAGLESRSQYRNSAIEAIRHKLQLLAGLMIKWQLPSWHDDHHHLSS